MGFAGLSFGHILVVLLVVILVFGTKKLGNIGADLGSAIKGFRQAMASSDDPKSDDSAAAASPQSPASETSQTTVQRPESSSTALHK